MRQPLSWNLMMVHSELSPDDLVYLTQAGFQLLSDWGLASSEQAALLGLPPDTPRRLINRHRVGVPLPSESDAYTRIALLLRIDNALQTLFPHSSVSAHLWVTTRNAHFRGEAPVATMLREGVEGIREVADSLSGRASW